MVAEPISRSRRSTRRSPGEEPRATQSVRMRPELRRRLRIWAAYQVRELSDLLEEAVSAHLDALDRARAAQGFKPIPGPDERADEAEPPAGGNA